MFQLHCQYLKDFCSLLNRLVLFVFNVDQLAISVVPKNLTIAKGKTAQFIATASGISTDETKFIYQWRKRGSKSLPDKVLGSNGTVLTIPNVVESDGGQYYCTVTNEWNRSIESSNVTLNVYGMLV